MPRSRTDHLDVSAPPDVALRALHQAVSALAKQETIAVDGSTITGRVGVSARSWGDLLTGTVQPVPNGSRVTVKSRSRLRTQFLDWGKHRKNVTEVLARVTSALGGSPPHVS